MPKPSIEAAVRAARSQRSWGLATLTAAVTGVVIAFITREGYWWLLAAAFAIVGLILIGTAKTRINMAVAMRGAHIQTMRGFRGTQETSADVQQALMTAMTMVAQGSSFSLDQSFDMAMDEILSRRGY